MLILYDLNKTKIAGLKNYKDLRIERTLDGDEVLFFSYPQIDPKHDSIKEETYVRTKKNEYVIKEVNVKDDWTEFVGKVNVEDLKGKAVNSFETVEQTCTNAVNLALAGTGWTIGSCDVTKKRTVRKTNCSSYDILQEIKKVYLCDFKFDAINKKIYIYQSMGSDKGSYFSDKLNLKKLDIQSNSYDFCTRIIPIGKDGLKINNINSGKEYVENYQYSNKVITVFWEDNRYTVVENLKEDATAKLNELSKPIRVYSAEIFDLANLNDKYKNILDYDLGDTITLLSKDKKVKEKQRIVKIVEYPDEPERNSCEIANRTLSFEDIQADTLEAVDTVNSVTTSDGMIDNSKVNFNPLRLEVVSLVAEKANIGELNAAVARIGTLEATRATITDLTAAVARIGILEVGSATVSQLNAANAKIATLETRAASIDTLLAGNIDVSNLKAGLITADSGLIANGAINDAMIQNLSVSKILAGDISTNKFRIVSSSGNMLISDNTIQIKDSTRVRVQIGKDASNDYNMYVWDSSGNLMFDATGLKASGIKTKIIRDDMVSDSANINATKIEKESLVTRINGATTLLLASKVKLDTENQTLEVAFNSLKSTVTTTANTVTSQGTSISTIQGQIQAKIWQQDITSATNGLDTRISATETSITAMNSAINLKVSTSDFTTYQGTVTNSLNSKANQSALNTTNGNVTALTTRVTTAEASISVLQNQISLKVEQSDITTAINNVQVGGRNLFKNSSFKNGLTLWQNWSNGGTNSLVDDSDSPSGKVLNAKGNSGRYYSWNNLTMSLIMGEKYILSVKAKGTGVFRFGWEGSSKSYSVTSDYKIYTQEFTYTSNRNFSFYGFSTDADILVHSIKLERGTKSTDYTEAPEDITTYTDTQISTAKAEIKVTTDSIISSVSSVQSSVTSLGTRVTSAESSITSLNNSITLKVNTSDFNSYKTTNDSAVNSKASQTALNTTNGNLTALTTRVSTAESSISVMQGQISLKVEQSDIENAVTSAQQGQNLIPDGSFENSGLGWTGGGTIVDDSHSGSKSLRLSTSSKSKSLKKSIIVIPGNKYKISFWYKTSSDNNGTSSNQKFRVGGADGNLLVALAAIPVSTDWVQKTLTWTVPSNVTEVKINISTDLTTGWIQYDDISFVDITDIDSATTRISTAESTITQLSSSIALKVETSIYNTKMTSLDNSISSLNSRVSSAELKITDNSIVSTVRTSTAYTSDLAAKANQSALNTTNSNVTTAQNTANAKRRVFTSTPTTPYDIGDLWVTTNGTGDLMTCKTARASGSYTASDWAKGVKYTDDTAANTAQTNLNTTNGNVTALTTRVSTAESSITQLNNSITLKVSTTDFNTYKTSNDSVVSSKASQSALNTTNGNVTSLTTRVTSTESSISILQGQITSKVSVGDFGTLITQNVSSVKFAVGQIGGANYIKDSSFEFGSIIMGSINGATISREGTNGTYPYIKDGYYRYKAITTINKDAGLYTDVSNLIPGSKYTFSAWVRPGAAALNIKLKIYTTGWVIVNMTDNTAPTVGSWYRFSCTFTASETTQRLCVVSYNPDGATFFTDCWQLIDGENVTEWSPNPNETSNVSVDISDRGLTVRNGAISILNNSGTQVLSGDTSGNLTIRGDFTTYDDSTGNIAIRLSKRTAYFYDWDSNAVCGEIFAGKIVGNITTRGMVFGAYRNKFLQVSYQGSDNNMYPVIAVDNGAFGSAGTVTITGGKQISTQNLYVSGSKNCIQDTESYGKRLLYAYETTESYLGDFVHGKINENGECVISIDEIFGECVNTEIQYHVFTQTYKGSITEIELYPNYFIVKGEAGTFFSCEIKAKRKGFEHVRLEQKFVEEHGVESIEDELKSLVSSDIDEELYGDLADELLEV